MKRIKHSIMLLMLCVFSFFFIMKVNAHSLLILANSKQVVVCENEAVLKSFRIVGNVINILKVLVPIIIIVTSTISVVKAVLGANDEEIKSSVHLFIQKVIIGAFVFFIPTIIGGIMSVVSGYDNTKAQFSKCGVCLTSVKKCDQYINISKNGSTGDSGDRNQDKVTKGTQIIEKK